MKGFKILLIFGILTSVVLAGGLANADEIFDMGKDYKAESPPRRILVDAITANTLPRASFAFDIHTFPNDGLQATLSVGILDRITVGLSYGSALLLSETTPDWNDRMEFLVKYRILTEDYTFPSLAFGYSSVGSGYWDEVNNRYAQKSKGFYLAATKSYYIYNVLTAFTGGINVSMEQRSVDNDPSAYVGTIFQINREVFILAEYDFAINDNKSYQQYGMGRGYLNIGVEWVITPSISLEFDMRNMLQNRRDAKTMDREIRLIYFEYL
ncbi:MAG: hypothetical protein GF307_06665 [candidate division Zixibacteria bacterium]|nr:hypothetical protein [candidate division Zixibacteria bacterium]